MMFARPDGGYWGSFRRSLLVCGKAIPWNLVPAAVALIGWHSPNGAFAMFVGMTILGGVIGPAIVMRQVGLISGIICLAVYSSISAILLLIAYASLQFFLGR